MSADIIANKYKIVREIARSNDVVYEAIDTAMGRRLAVKELVIPTNLTGQARRERIERFNREARATGKLSHPNIVTVYDYGEDSGRYFIAMEFLEGGTLRDLLQARGALPVNEALDIACQVLAGLAHAHAHQVVHRDIKPDNIHILPGGQVKITDFGIARLTEEASLTGDGQVFGTPSYMSPEQIKGQAIDHRSDIFSLGIVLYEMLAGRKPFTGDSVISITYSIMENQPPPLSGISYGIEQAVFRALSKDPGRRFYSAEEMRRELKNADAVPSMFFTPGTQSGAYGGLGAGSGASGYGGPVANPGAGAYAPAPFPSPGVPSAAPVPLGGPLSSGPLPGAQGSTVFAPPPVNAAPVPTGQAGQTGAGPFVNWNPNGANLPPGYVPPPPSYPRHPPRPLMSEATKTFFKALLLAIVIGSALLGGVLLFQKAYDRQKTVGAEEAINALNREGEKLFYAGNLQGAIQKYEAAYKQGMGRQAGDIARKNLVIIYNRLGVDAFEHGDDRSAENYWFRARDLDPNNQDTNDNLGKLYNRIGDKDQALKEWRESSTGQRVGSPDPNAPGDNSFQTTRAKNALDYYNQGMEAMNRGDMDGARDLWTKAVGEAPGTEGAEKARKALESTNTGPSF